MELDGARHDSRGIREYDSWADRLGINLDMIMESQTRINESNAPHDI